MSPIPTGYNQRLNANGTLGGIVHESAYVSESAIIGENTRIDARASICIGVKIGDRCVINEGVTIADQTSLGCDTYVYRDVNIGPNCRIGRGSSIKSDVLQRTKLPPRSEFTAATTMRGLYKNYNWCLYRGIDKHLMLSIGCQNHKVSTWLTKPNTLPIPAVIRRQYKKITKVIRAVVAASKELGI